MQGNFEDLKIALKDSGNPFVWIKEEGWQFNECAEGIKYSSEEVLNASGFEELVVPTEEPKQNSAIKKGKK